MESNHESLHPLSSMHSSGATGDDSSLESMQARVETFCLKLLEEVEAGRLDATSFIQCLQDAGASPAEANDFLKQFQENAVHQQRDGSPTTREAESRPQDEPSVNPEQSADAVAWAQLHQKVADTVHGPDVSLSGPSLALGDLAKIFDLAKPHPTVIPSDILAEASLAGIS